MWCDDADEDDDDDVKSDDNDDVNADDDANVGDDGEVWLKMHDWKMTDKNCRGWKITDRLLKDSWSRAHA